MSLDKLIFKAQRNEITEYRIYLNLAKLSKNSKNKEILETIAKDEFKHYEYFKSVSKKEVHPSNFKVFLYTLCARLLGLTFSVRLMEYGEGISQKTYALMRKLSPEMANKVQEILEDEEKHESELISKIDSKGLTYVSSIVLGLNDALVELTGALAGFTLALGNPKLIVLAGLITGIAASLSMASSEYLSSKEEGSNEKSAFSASIYTGLAYLITVALLITPYLVLKNPFHALAITLSIALFIIFCFTAYIAIAKNLSFRKKFLEMATISLSVALINFGIGLLLKPFGIES